MAWGEGARIRRPRTSADAGRGEDVVDLYDGDPGTAETLLGYDDDDDDTFFVDFGEEQPDGGDPAVRPPSSRRARRPG